MLAMLLGYIWSLLSVILQRVAKWWFAVFCDQYGQACVWNIALYKPRASRQFSDWFHSFTLTYHNYMPSVSSSFFPLSFCSFFASNHMCILSLSWCTCKNLIIILILMSPCPFLLINQNPEPREVRRVRGGEEVVMRNSLQNKSRFVGIVYIYWTFSRSWYAVFSATWQYHSCCFRFNKYLAQPPTSIGIFLVD